MYGFQIVNMIICGHTTRMSALLCLLTLGYTTFYLFNSYYDEEELSDPG